MLDQSKVVLGQIVGVYGIKGWLKVKSYTRPRKNIFTYSPWLVKQVEDWRAMQLVGGRSQGKGLVAELTDITDRDKATALVGADIGVDRQQLPATENGSYYWCDLVNLQVINRQDEPLGIVRDILETGANDVLVVADSKQRHLIPYIQGVYVKEVAIDKGIMQVDWQPDY